MAAENTVIIPTEPPEQPPQPPQSLNLSLFSIQTLKGKRQCIRLKAPERKSRQPIHFTLLLDTSGSMDEENRLKNVKWSLTHLLKYLTANDQLSLVEFNSNSEILLKRLPMTTENKDRLTYIIDRIVANGGTNLSSSLITCRDCLYMDNNDTLSMKQGIVLLTDGHANQGTLNYTEIVSILRRVIQDSNGASLNCIGYGVTHNAVLLRTLAAEGGGSYNVVQNLEDTAEIFANILGGLLTCSYQKMEIIIPGVHSKDELDTHYSVHVDNEANTTRISLGDLHSENEVVLVLPETISEVTIRGYDLQTLQSILYKVTPSLDSGLSTNDYALGFANFYRQETAKLIENVRGSIASGQVSVRFESLANDIENLRANIRETMTKYPHALYALLLEEILEIEIAMATVRDRSGQTNAEQVAMETSQVLAQHSAYISLGRGVRSHFTPATPNLRQISQVTASEPGLQTAFSNGLQRHISREITSQIYEEPNENPTAPAPPPPPARPHQVPMRLHSPPRINRLAAVPSPPPVVPLQRATAFMMNISGIANEPYNVPAWVPISPVHSVSSQSTVD